MVTTYCLVSARYGETDYDDIRFLMEKLQTKTAESLYAVVLAFFPKAWILPKTQYLVEQLIEEMAEEG